MNQVLLVALGGALGSVARYGVGVGAARLFGLGFPWGTLIVNLLGAMAFGAVVGAGRARGGVPPTLEAVLLLGLLGGFTTFSSYTFQAVALWESGRHAAAAGYVVASNLIGFLAVWFGLRLAG
jgi:CrcB protein